MERDMNQSALPTLCRGGCGFYGSSATENYCSKCFKDTLKRKQDPGHISPTSSMTPKSLDSASARERTLVSAIESLVTPNQAGCSSISTMAMQGLDKAEALPASMEAQAVMESPDDKSAETTPTSSPQKQKNRCDVCRKRVGLTGFDCRCGGLFCGSHRYSNTHDCSFDYKALGEQEIRKNNPVVKTEKVVKL